LVVEWIGAVAGGVLSFWLGTRVRAKPGESRRCMYEWSCTSWRFAGCLSGHCKTHCRRLCKCEPPGVTPEEDEILRAVRGPR
jgi:hypothetical protein